MAAAAFRRASTGARGIGWRTRCSEALYREGLAHYQRSEYQAALDLFRERLTVEETLASKVGRGRAHYGIALCLRTLGRLEDAQVHDEKGGILSAASGDGLYVAKNLSTAALGEGRDGDAGAARSTYIAMASALRGLDLNAVPARFRPSRRQVLQTLSNALTNAASMSAKLQDTDAARTYATESLLAARESKNTRLIRSATAELARLEGATHDAAGRPVQALSQYTQAERLYRRLGARSDQADTLRRVALVLIQIGDFPRAVKRAEEAVAIQKMTGAKRELAQALLVLGTALRQLSRLDEADLIAAQALELARELENPALQIQALLLKAMTLKWRSEYGRAFHLYNQALAIHRAHPTRTELSMIQRGLSGIYLALGDFDRALDLLEDSERSLEESGTLYDKSPGMQMRAELLGEVGRHAEAADLLKQLLSRYEKNGNRMKLAAIHNATGLLLLSQSQYADAAAAFEEAIGLYVSIGHPGSEISARVNRGYALLWDRRYQMALVESEAVYEQANDYGQDVLRAAACGQLAEVHYWLEDDELAIRYAREGCVIAGRVGMERAEGERAIMRHSAFGRMALWGLQAAIRSDDPAAIHEFIERDRATSLAASLAGREALRAAVVPPKLRAREAAAKTAAAAAYHRFEEARQGGETLQVVRDKRREMEAARALQWDAVAAIQRARRQQAKLVYPTPATVQDVHKALPKDAAFIQYGYTRDHLLAVLITKAEALCHLLGSRKKAEHVLDALREDPADEKKAAAAQRLLFGYLKLGPEIKTLLIAPVKQIAYVPFSVLEPERTVTMVPSSTAWLLLQQTRVAGGEKILAVGDPSYGGRPSPSPTDKELLRGSTLTRLPETRVEAKAIGDQTLLGVEASETRFREVAGSRKHWRAIHLACHGLVDDKLPTRSALVLTHDSENDGYLHANEVIAELNLSADLVVLSACETGRGRVFTGEGLVGLSSAFMLAGTPRVIASLWKVEDAATQALMRKFYELWHPRAKPGTDKQAASPTGLTAAQALQKAQAYIREHPDHPEWKNPHYWAAWVLWGLSD